MRHYLLEEINIRDIEDPDLRKAVLEFQVIQDQIDEINENILGPLKNRYADLAAVIEEALRELGEESLRTERAIYRIVTKPSKSYKTAFEAALTKVNARTRKVLQEILDSTEKISTGLKRVRKISESRVRINEGFMDTIFAIWDYLKAKMKKIFAGIRDISRLNDTLEDLTEEA